MKLCVTGAPGWLGSRLVEVLTEGFGDPGAPALPTVDSVTLLVQPGLEPPTVRPAHTRVVYGDVRDPRAVEKAVEGADVVLHLAAIIHPTWRGLDELMAINTGGTKNLLEAAIKAGAKRFVLMSSNSVAGTSTALGGPSARTTASRLTWRTGAARRRPRISSTPRSRPGASRG
jgi:nucleoside-diphosphate-sugar epimerase